MDDFNAQLQAMLHRNTSQSVKQPIENTPVTDTAIITQFPRK